MTSTVPTKIVLKSTTRMSLNDRFSSIAPTVQSIRAHMATEHQVSVANQRLAQQLARRPGIHTPASNMYLQQPRGGGGRRGNFNNAAVPMSNLQQRLGKSNVKNRLSLPGNQPMRGRGRGRGRGGNIPLLADPGNNQWMNVNMRGRGNFIPRGVPRGAGGVPRGAGGVPRGAGGVPRGAGGPRGVGGPRGRGAFRGRGRGAFNRFNEQNTMNSQNINTRGNFRGRRPGGRRGRGAGRGNNSSVSVADLDNQLDAYMAKTKTHLDSELDAYMSEVSK